MSMTYNRRNMYNLSLYVHNIQDKMFQFLKRKYILNKYEQNMDNFVIVCNIYRKMLIYNKQIE